MIIEQDITKGILREIINIKNSLPKKQRKLCDYIVENYRSIGLLTVKELADKAEVSTSTVLRVMQILGYENFQEMRKDLHKVSVDSSISQYKHMQHLFKNYNKSNDKGSTSLTEVWQNGIGLLDKTLDPPLIENFEKAIDLIIQASRINIFGVRGYKSVAYCLEHLFEEFYSKTRQLSFDSEAVYDRILQFKKDEVLIVFSYEPYTNRTLEIAEFTYERGIPIILFTDHLSCPLVSFATVILKVQPSEQQFTLIPTIALIEALALELGRRTSATSVKHLEELEILLKQKNILR
ncbi:MurR/RpiR family transcriptional regulator [Ammoniphilus sp. 3BR4]|uniref:MurR/RpiR family transcriptional regulator n=1 Tax=Ammoniphilus sp. 3BR4 TaxID=3158265 RepID=UPI0034669881